MAEKVQPVEEILWSWPTVMKVAKDEWTRNFAKSIARQSRRRGWKPTPRQHALMSKIVADIYRRDDPDEDLPLIE